MAHTKGPWRKSRYGWAVISGEDETYLGGYLVAECSGPENLPLISAAPNLLAVCEQVLVTLQNHADYSELVAKIEDDLKNFQRPFKDEIRILQAAIAKAKEDSNDNP